MLHHRLQGGRGLTVPNDNQGAWKHRAGTDFYPSSPSRSGGPGLEPSHSKETTLILIQGETRSTWFMCVWLLLESLRCQRRRKVWPTCRAKFTLTSKWWTRQSHWNTASILHPAPLAPLVRGCWGLGIGQEKSQQETSLRRNPELGLVINQSPAINKLPKSNDFFSRQVFLASDNKLTDSSCKKVLLKTVLEPAWTAVGTGPFRVMGVLHTLRERCLWGPGHCLVMQTLRSSSSWPLPFNRSEFHKGSL